MKAEELKAMLDAAGVVFVAWHSRMYWRLSSATREALGEGEQAGRLEWYRFKRLYKSKAKVGVTAKHKLRYPHLNILCSGQMAVKPSGFLDTEWVKSEFNMKGVDLALHAYRATCDVLGIED